MKRYINCLVIFTLSFFSMTWYSSCKKADLVTTTTTDVNMLTYLRKNPDQFSEFVKIIEKAGYASFLDAYGIYTLFAPGNEAVKIYLQEIGKSSVDQLTEDESKDIVKFHLLEDSIITKDFRDGKLPLVTMYGQYLLTGVVNKDGASNYIINRQALVTKGDIDVGNGLIHAIDKVLKPAKLTLAKMIEANPDYSIFTEALKATGFYDSLNINNNPNIDRRFLTVLAESNQVLKAAGINNYTDLFNRYSNLKSPKNPKDSLYTYVAYHIVPDARYLADIIGSSSHETLAPLEVVTSKLSGERVLLNDMEFNGVHEVGVELNRPTSDNSATNGVLHNATTHLYIKKRNPFPVYWDVADFPEIKRQPSFYRKRFVSFAHGSIKDITWEKTDAANDLRYESPGSARFPVFNNDWLRLRLGSGSRNLWYEFRTPLLVKGKYKIWICYVQQKGSGSTGQPGGSQTLTQVYFDGQLMPRTFNFVDVRPSGSDGELEALGWKSYTPGRQGTSPARLVGTVDVQTTDRHIIRMQVLTGGQDPNHLDMIHFIPINMNQLRPVFAQDGTIVP